MIPEINVIGHMDNSDGTFESANRVYSENGISPTLPTRGNDQQPKIIVYKTLTTDESNSKHSNRVIRIKQATKDGYVNCKIGGVADLTYPTSQTRRGRVIEEGDVSPTLTTENIPNVIEPWVWKIGDEYYKIRIRKLTPKSCWRLMGFSDEDFDKAAKVNSNTQLYKQAGNSIVVNCLEEIFKNMLGEQTNNLHGTQITFDDLL